MADVRLDAGLFTTDVIIELSSAEAAALAAGGAAAVPAVIGAIPPPFSVVAGALVGATAAEVAQKNQGRGVRIVITVVTALLIISGWHIDGL